MQLALDLLEATDIMGEGAAAQQQQAAEGGAPQQAAEAAAAEEARQAAADAAADFWDSWLPAAVEDGEAVGEEAARWGAPPEVQARVRQAQQEMEEQRERALAIRHLLLTQLPDAMEDMLAAPGAA